MEPLVHWLAAAGLGVLHGLSPATGWTFAAAALRFRRGGRHGAAPAAACAGLGAWCFAASALHGAGLMLLPAWTSLCAPAATLPRDGAQDVLMSALVAFGVHTAAMLLTTLALAFGASRAAQAAAALWRRVAGRLARPKRSGRAAQCPHQV